MCCCFYCFSHFVFTFSFFFSTGFCLYICKFVLIIYVFVLIYWYINVLMYINVYQYINIFISFRCAIFSLQCPYHSGLNVLLKLVFGLCSLGDLIFNPFLSTQYAKLPDCSTGLYAKFFICILMALFNKTIWILEATVNGHYFDIFLGSDFWK